MGSEIEVRRGTSLPYEIILAATDSIAKIEFTQNDREGTVWTHGGRDFVRLQGALTIEESRWTYVRVTQTHRNMAWSSPIWVDVT